MSKYEVKFGKSYDADVFNGPDRVASAQFYGEDSLAEAALLPICGGEFLTVKLDPRLADPRACGAYPSDYARKVAEMVYQMLVF